MARSRSLAAAWSGVLLALAVVLPVTGCVDAPRRPLDPAKLEQEQRARTLADPELKSLCVERLDLPPDAEWPPASLDLPMAVLAAWHFRPEMTAARAAIAAAQAKVQQAGKLPNPTLSLTPGRASPAASSPWVLAAALDFVLPLGGRRDRERSVADQDVELAIIDAAAVAWRIYAETRDAMTDAIHARDAALLAAAAVANADQRATLLRERLQAGLAGKPECDLAALETARARADALRAEALRSAGNGRFAAALGLLADEHLGSMLGALRQIPPREQLDRIGGVPDRLDLRRTLAEYEACERSLELELARQYPDLHLGPGWEYDQGTRKYTLGWSIDLPLFDRNQAGIAEALARREQKAAEFETRQAASLAEIAAASQRLEAARVVLQAVIGEAQTLANDGYAAAFASWSAGAIDGLEWIDAQREYAVHSNNELAARFELAQAAAAWEDATQSPCDALLGTWGIGSTGEEKPR